MLTRIVVIFFIISFSVVSSDYIYRKLCKDVDANSCNVHQVDIDKCDHAKFCRMKRNKKHTIKVEFTPNFSAEKLKLATYSDHANTNLYDFEIDTPKTTCEFTTCPTRAENRQTLDYPFKPIKTLPRGKYPIKMKIWNEANETEACCFTFNIKIK